MKKKSYSIKFISSGNKIVTTWEHNRSRIMKEWARLINLSHDEITKELKTGKDIILDKIEIHDWVGNRMATKVF